MHKKSNICIYILEQARLPFAEDDLAAVQLETSAEVNTDKCLCCVSCALPGGEMETDETFLQNAFVHCSSKKKEMIFF